MSISPGLSSKLPSISAAGPVRMLSVVGAENSRIDLFAMAGDLLDWMKLFAEVLMISS